jgi:hypothetical protein
MMKPSAHLSYGNEAAYTSCSSLLPMPEPQSYEVPSRPIQAARVGDQKTRLYKLFSRWWGVTSESGHCARGWLLHASDLWTRLLASMCLEDGAFVLTLAEGPIFYFFQRQGTRVECDK